MRFDILRSMGYRYQYNHSLVKFAQKNKHTQTEAEKHLWFHLRGRQLLGFKFRRQYPINNYILDFYCVEKQLAIELDGSQHMVSTYDNKRSKQLNKQGITIIRFWDNDVFTNINGVLETIRLHLEATSS